MYMKKKKNKGDIARARALFCDSPPSLCKFYAGFIDRLNGLKKAASSFSTTSTGHELLYHPKPPTLLVHKSRKERA